MKKVILLTTVLLLSISFLSAQEWVRNLDEEKRSRGELTLYDYSKAFDEFWAPYNVVEGYYMENGEREKAPYWKLFKRWEHYWTNRVDPQTGAFPETAGSDIFEKYMAKNAANKASSGNWTNLGTNNSNGGYAGIGRLNCVAFHTNSNILYVGSPSGGLWKSTNAGTSWSVLTDANSVLGVSDIVVIPGSPDVIYIATGDRDGGSAWSMSGGQSNDNNSIGILKSTDGGITWNTTGLSWTASQRRTINRLLLDPSDATKQTLLAATSVGVYKTNDGGSNWSQLTSTHFIDLEYKPGLPSYIYGSTMSGDIHRSTDSGASWNAELTTNYYRTELAVTQSHSGYVYAVIANSGGGLAGVFKSTDSGDNFSQTYAGNTIGNNILGYYCTGSGDINAGQGDYDLCIAADPTNANIIYIGGVNTWKSTNGGTSWSNSNMWTSGITYNPCFSPVVHADKHFLAFQNGTSTLFECNDGGLYKTTNGGSSWTDLSNGMVISQIYRLGVSQSSSTHMMTGLQDNGSKAYVNGSWQDVIGGDGFECAIDPNNTATQYGSLYYGRFKRTTNTWSTSGTDITSDGSNPINNIDETGYWVSPFSIDPNNSNTLYVGLKNVWKSTNQGDAWTKISPWTTSTTLRSMAIAPSNSDYIYAATQTSFYRTSDGGTNWSGNLAGSLPTGSGYITYIAVKANDPQTVWVSLGGYNSYGVYESTDGGSTWTNISTGLPSLPVMSIVQNKQNTNQNELYVGTDVGVYVKVGAGNWTSFMSGLPNVFVPELEIYYDNSTPTNSRLRAATYGRGLWESELYTPTAPPTADFVASTTTPANSTELVVFTDQSTNAPTTWSWSFTPNTITYHSGTSSSSQNPIVTFNQNGPYSVSLLITNSQGADTETKTDYLRMGSPGLWTGTTNSEWNTDTNWDNHIVPTSTTDVTIPSSASNWPTHTGDFTMGLTCNSLHLATSAQLTIGGNLTIPTGKQLVCAANSILNIEGNWTNDGVFDPGTGTVNFIGNNSSQINIPFSGNSMLIDEDFATWPGSWNGNIGTGNGQFSQQNTNAAGGSSPEVRFLWVNSTTTKRLYSDPVNTSGQTSLTLDFKHYVDDYDNSGSYTLKVEYSTDGNNWYDSDWTLSPSANVGPAQVSTTLNSTSHGVGTSTYYIAFTITGNLNNIDYWYIDDVQLYYPSTNDVTFHNLSITKNNAEVNANGEGSILINNNFSIKPNAFFTNPANVTITATGNTTIEADATGSASFIQSASSFMANVQTYLTQDEWHYISSPVSNQPISPEFINTSSNPLPSATDFYKFDESDSMWRNIKDASGNLNATFETNMTMNRGYALAYTDNNYTKTFSGSLNAINQSSTMSKTASPGAEGWNIKGNPFPATVAANNNADASNNLLLTNGPALDDQYEAIYLWDSDDYLTINHVSDATYISPTQAFFVKAASNGASFVVNTNHQKHNAATFYKNGNSLPRFTISLTGPQGNSNHTQIAFVSGSTKGLDPGYDARKFKANPNIALYSILVDDDGGDYAIQSIPQLSGQHVKLGVDAGQTGYFTFSDVVMENMTGQTVYLEDKDLGMFVNLNTTPEYVFSIPQIGSYESRFELHFGGTITDIEELGTDENPISIFSKNNEILLQNMGNQAFEGSVQFFTLTGQLIDIRSIIIEANSNTKVSYNYASGIYLIQFVSDKVVVSKKFVVE